MWLDMKTSIVFAMVAIATFLAPAEVTAYDCLDLPNVYTVEDMNEIKRHCEHKPVLGSSIYPSATWILHTYLTESGYSEYTEWLTSKNKTLRQICVITLGGDGTSAFSFKSVSGHCGDSYPISHADIHNFIDIGTGNSKEMAASQHALVQDEKKIDSNDHYVMLVQTSRKKKLFGKMSGMSSDPYKKENYVDDNNKYEIRVFSENKRTSGEARCPAFLLKNSAQLKSCTSIVGPLVYNGSFYGMDKIEDKSLRPYHHGCFTVVNFGDQLTNLDFLEQIVTDSDYVDRCIGKFANVIKAPKFCPNPRRYYASMDPDPEGEVRTAFIKSENNVKGKLEVKVEFLNGADITYDCVHECTTSITQQDNDDTWTSPRGLHDFSCRYLNGTVTLTKTGWKGPKKNDTIVLEHIERIIGQLKINAEVGYNVLPSLEIVDGSAKEGLLLI